MAFDCATWRSISVTDAASSSAADAMSRTLADASADAEAALLVRVEALSAAPVRWPEAASIWSDMRAELGERRFDFGAEAADLERNAAPGGARAPARLRGPCLELLVLAHGLLKNLDRARERPDLVAALAVRDDALHVARGHGLRDPGNAGERTSHRAPDDHRAGAGQHNCDNGDASR